MDFMTFAEFSTLLPKCGTWIHEHECDCYYTVYRGYANCYFLALSIK